MGNKPKKRRQVIRPALVRVMQRLRVMPEGALLFAIAVCRSRMPEVAAYLKSIRSGYVAIRSGVGGQLLVISLGPPCTDAECGIDHEVSVDAACEAIREAAEATDGGKIVDIDGYMEKGDTNHDPSAWVRSNKLKGE